jgi:hypothetical protein
MEPLDIKIYRLYTEETEEFFPEAYYRVEFEGKFFCDNDPNTSLESAMEWLTWNLEAE